MKESIINEIDVLASVMYGRNISTLLIYSIIYVLNAIIESVFSRFIFIMKEFYKIKMYKIYRFNLSFYKTVYFKVKERGFDNLVPKILILLYRVYIFLHQFISHI